MLTGDEIAGAVCSAALYAVILVVAVSASVGLMLGLIFGGR